ncbi:MAG: DUF1127 domain-containing protein [Rhodobacteraceae bacterium]|nr:DUF1127 domain-containing protein [Paracoccaceae bacterium]
MTTLTLHRLRTLENAPRIPVPAAILVAAAVMIVKWSNRQRTRQHLSRLDRRMLTDIGVTEAQARIEADKRFWQR